MYQEFNPGVYKIIYAYTIDYDTHKGAIKVGDATLHSLNTIQQIIEKSHIIDDTPIGQYLYTSYEIEKAARKRIAEQTNTAGIKYELLFAVLAVKKNDKNEWISFRDHEVHTVLLRNGIKRAKPTKNTTAKEWFIATPDTVKSAIHYVQTGNNVITQNEDTKDSIILRQEQRKAVDFTKKRLKGVNINEPQKVLWNAIMRFGKTLTTYQFIKEQNDINKTLIITHRPVVASGWFEDYKKILEEAGYAFGSKNYGENWDNVKNKEKFVYFVSIQDMRGSFNDTFNIYTEDADLYNSIDTNDSFKKDFINNSTNIDSIKEIITNDDDNKLEDNLIDQKDNLKYEVVKKKIRAYYIATDKRDRKRKKYRPQIDIYPKNFNNDLSESFYNKFNNDTTATLISNQEKQQTRLLDNDVEENFINNDKTTENIVEVNEEVDEIFSKNKDIFDTTWDLVVWDEAHEAAKTQLTKVVLDKLKKKNILSLSGTPFKITDDFSADEIYVWDYLSEQRAVERYNKENPGEHSPYDSLVKLKTYLYSLNKNFKTSYIDETGMFRFNKFFETDNETGKFVHEKDVRILLNLLCNSESEEDSRNFPFDNFKKKNAFAHTFWLLPNIASIKAMKELLENHSYFGEFKIVNASGDNFEGKTALDDVKNTINNNNYSITLSCGMLTTGVTVPEWTAIFMFNNTTSPSLYMQAAFRVKSSGILPNGEIKEYGYIFDFAPQRILQIVSEIAENKAEFAGKTKKSDTDTENNNDDNGRELAKELAEKLNLLETSYGNGNFTPVSVGNLMSNMTRVFATRTVNSGYDNFELFNYDKINSMTAAEAKALRNTGAVIGSRNGNDKRHLDVHANAGINNAINIDSEKLNNDDVNNNSTPLNRTAAEAKELQDRINRNKNEMAKNRRKAIGILKSAAVRVPLILFGSNIENIKDKTVTVDNFTDLIDDVSWTEFMPKGFKKNGEECSWESIKDFFDNDVFEAACAESLKNIKEIFDKDPMSRVPYIANYFQNCKNPDKETVLTPFKVVNEQNVKTFGGLNWLNEIGYWRANDGNYYEFATIDDDPNLSFEPVWIDDYEVDGIASNDTIEDNDSVTIIENEYNIYKNYTTTVMDMNSKTALYPLYSAANYYYQHLMTMNIDPFNKNYVGANGLWNLIISSQIFINCRVRYSLSIAERVLRGYNETVKVNGSVVDIISLIKFLKENKIDYTNNNKLWLYIFNSTKFDSVAERVHNIMSLDKAGILELLDTVNDSTVTGFTAIIGNPPYQKDADNTKFTTAVYHNFMNVAKILGEFVSLVYPSRWTQSGIGEGIKEFKETELNSPHYSKFYDYSKSEELFTNVNIAGGVNYFLWERDKKEFGLDYYYDNTYARKEKLGDSDSHIRDPRLSKIVNEKINTKNSLYNIVSPWGYYGTERADQIEDLANNLQNLDNVLEMYYINKGLQIAKIGRDYTDKDVDDYKVAVSKTANRVSGFAYPRADRIFIMNPGQACTISFMKIGSFKTEQEAINCLRYLKTDFCNFLLGIITPAQNMYRKSYVLLPNVNFKTGEIIDKPGLFLDFDKPETLDKQLAEIYDLTAEEQQLISSDLKQWRDKVSVTADK